MQAGLISVLINCETSAVIRDAFRARGFDAWSCDLLDTEGDPRFHIKGDMFDAAASRPWDLMIAHPSCTYLCVSGIHWNGRVAGRSEKTDAAVEDVKRLWALPIKHICIENPIGVLSTRFMKPHQVVQPYQFNEDASKATCYWLKNLPRLRPTGWFPPRIVQGGTRRQGKMEQSDGQRPEQTWPVG